MTRLVATAVLLAIPAAAGARQAAPAPVSPASAPDPARVAAARELIDAMMPAETRDRLIDGMMTPLLANVRRTMTENPQFAAALGSDPRITRLFDQFMQRQATRTTELMHRSLPAMMPAMANAYARRFDLAQLRELRAFFGTPTGRAYAQAATTIMADPDVVEWQRRLMTDSLGHVQEDMADFAAQVGALEKKP